MLTWSVFNFDTIDDNIWGPVKEDRASKGVPDNSLVYAGSRLEIIFFGEIFFFRI